jgi:hypothetical protein
LGNFHAGQLTENALPSIGCASHDGAVLAQERSTSATLQACAMQPRGLKGSSASNISLIEPMQPSLR